MGDSPDTRFAVRAQLWRRTERAAPTVPNHQSWRVEVSVLKLPLSLEAVR